MEAPPEEFTTTGTSAAIVCEMAVAKALAMTGVSEVNRFATLAVTASALTVVGPVPQGDVMVIGWQEADPNQPLSLWTIADLTATNWILADTISEPLPDSPDGFQVPLLPGSHFFRLSQPAARLSGANHFVEFSVGLFLSLITGRILRV